MHPVSLVCVLLVAWVGVGVTSSPSTTYHRGRLSCFVCSQAYDKNGLPVTDSNHTNSSTVAPLTRNCAEPTNRDRRPCSGQCFVNVTAHYRGVRYLHRSCDTNVSAASVGSGYKRACHFTPYRTDCEFRCSQGHHCDVLTLRMSAAWLQGHVFQPYSLFRLSEANAYGVLHELHTHLAVLVVCACMTTSVFLVIWTSRDLMEAVEYTYYEEEVAMATATEGEESDEEEGGVAATAAEEGGVTEVVTTTGGVERGPKRGVTPRYTFADAVRQDDICRLYGQNSHVPSWTV